MLKHKKRLQQHNKVKVTQDEVAALVTKINNDKNNAIAEINKQTTAQGVTTEKIMVSQC